MFKFNIRSAGQCASRTANRIAPNAKRKALTDGSCLLIQFECFTLCPMRHALCFLPPLHNPQSQIQNPQSN
jgi:hypothetical protein